MDNGHRPVGRGGSRTSIMTAEEWYVKGNEYRRKGDWKHAMDCYMEAVELDPDSPAAVAKQMLDDILNFYHKDAYNP